MKERKKGRERGWKITKHIMNKIIFYYLVVITDKRYSRERRKRGRVKSP